MNYLTIHEIESVLEAAMLESARDHLILLLSFRHGMRRGEVASLTVSDIKNGQVHVERLKGSLATTQPLMPSENDLLDETMALDRWLHQRPQGTDFLFPTYNGSISGKQVGRIAKEYLTKANVHEDLRHHHALKHAFCSIQARNGVKIEYIAQSVGHKDIKNTRIYLNITDHEAMDKAAQALTLALGGAQ